MQQSDYILREIEKIGAMLMGMIGKMVRRKKEDTELSEDEYTELKNELAKDSNFNIEELIQTDKTEFEIFFHRENGFNDKNIEILADLLVAVADISIEEDRTNLLNIKALELYQYLDSSSKTLSFDRMNKVENLNKKLNV